MLVFKEDVELRMETITRVQWVQKLGNYCYAGVRFLTSENIG